MDDVLHELARWFGFAFAIFIAPCGAAFVYLCGKKTGATGRFQKRAFRCIAATIRFPNMAFRLSVAMVSIGFAYVALDRWQDQEPEPFARILVTAGMSLSILSTFGVALWRMTFGRAVARAVPLARPHVSG